jgi:hypothetical protein
MCYEVFENKKCMGSFFNFEFAKFLRDELRKKNPNANVYIQTKLVFN